MHLKKGPQKKDIIIYKRRKKDFRIMRPKRPKKGLKKVNIYVTR